MHLFNVSTLKQNVLQVISHFGISFSVGRIRQYQIVQAKALQGVRIVFGRQKFSERKIRDNRLVGRSKILRYFMVDQNMYWYLAYTQHLCYLIHILRAFTYITIYIPRKIDIVFVLVLLNRYLSINLFVAQNKFQFQLFHVWFCCLLVCLFLFAGKIIPFVELTVAHASVLTILAITFERYYAICEPLRAGYVCTKARAIVICIITWLVAAFCTR